MHSGPKQGVYRGFIAAGPATAYKVSVLAFTAKREGGLADWRPVCSTALPSTLSHCILQVRTDSAKPSPPRMTGVNCTGAGDIQVILSCHNK